MTTPAMREYRRQIAERSLAEYETWCSANGGGRLDGAAIGQLASCARWLLESLEEQAEGEKP